MSRSYKTLWYAAAILIALVMVLPFVSMVATSLKGPEEVYLAKEITFWPKALRLSNYPQALRTANWGRYFFNSFVVTSVSVVGSLLLNSLAGYSFSRLRFRGRDLLFFLLLIGIMIPPQALIIPQFLILKNMPFFGGNDWTGSGGIGWLNSYWALIVPQLSGSFGIFLCRQFYLNFPQSLDEAAKLDGANAFTTFTLIYLPLSKPLFATLGILKTVSVWNDFFYPLIVTNTDSMRTVQLGLQVFRGAASVEWHLLMAATALVTFPVILVFVLAQRYFIAGIVSSGIKG